MSQEENQIKGIKALAAFLHCSVQTAHNLKKSGKIKYYQFGRVVFFDKAEVLAAIQKGGSHE